jgi:uncharacterized membrane protein YjgN (DUF898 family)
MAMADISPPAPETGRFERASFSGSAKEYFGIWIVNVLLTMVTFGIYSAWAKVRRKRYFYGNTVILGRGFDYHATGRQIFVSRVIVVGVVLAMQALTILSPLFSIVTTIVILLALPWLMVRSLRFNARVTSYRNVRFDFVGKPLGAFVALILGSFVAFISLGTLAPIASRWLWRYILNNMRYGDRPFSTEPQLKSLYGVWLLPAMMVLLGSIIFGFVAVALALGSDVFTDFDTSDETQLQLTIIFAIYGVGFTFFVLYGLAALFYRAGVHNVVLSAAKLDGRHELLSDMSRVRYAWIAISNVIVTILTLGLMRPWAAVRLARYVNEHTGIRINGDPGEVMSSIASSGAAISAEYMDMEGFEFGF